MTVKTYATLLISMIMSAVATPWLEELIKIYVITVVIFVTLLINLIFFWARLRDIIVNQLVAAVIQHVLKDRDMQKLVSWSQRHEDLNKKIQDNLEKARTDDGSHSG